MKRRAKTYWSKWLAIAWRATIIPVLLLPIACLDGGGEETANFKDCKVWPQYRCPDDDVRAHWSTSPDTPINITIEGQTVSKPGHGDYLIKANDFNQYPAKVKIVLQIDDEGGEKRTFTVETVRGTQSYLRTASKVSGTDYRYIVDLPPQVWSDDIYVYGLELYTPKSYRCVGSSTDNPFEWQYDKGMAISGYLNKNNGYQVGFDPQPKAAGEWYFTLRNPSNEHMCDGWKLISTAPQIWFKVACRY